MVRVDVVIRFTIWLCNHLKATTLVHNIGDVDGIVPSNSPIRTLVNRCCGGVEPQKSLSSVSNFSRSHVLALPSEPFLDSEKKYK